MVSANKLNGMMGCILPMVATLLKLSKHIYYGLARIWISRQMRNKLLQRLGRRRCARKACIGCQPSSL